MNVPLRDPFLFQTNRLLVRLLKASDLPDFHDMQGNEAVMCYVGGKANTWEEDEKELQRLIQLYDQVGNTFWVWAIDTIEDAAFIGTCAIIVNQDGAYEIGFRFREQYWGKGYGLETAQGLLAFAFSKLELDHLVAYVDERNRGSVKILDRCLPYIRTFYNEQEGCTDRAYRLEREQWEQRFQAEADK
ncbi:MAG TPA: GNAT family N-acetyltransferase [Saprospiraceae bacterium]|nr:GNAT family N-acetyltransferase [Saprospiraceae bacterium]HMQ83693.1 GNAT family N-acetyltransferase [Saprospiraceae bacterium]